MIIMKNGRIIEDELIGRLTGKIIKELADEKVSIDEAKVILDETKEKIDVKSYAYKSLRSISCKE